MQMMQALHEKMTSATTPEARQNVMDKQQEEMQACMGMMSQMQRGGMMGGMGGGMMAQKGMPADANPQMQMMQKRMDMMEMMMQTMMDQQGMMASPKVPRRCTQEVAGARDCRSTQRARLPGCCGTSMSGARVGGTPSRFLPFSSRCRSAAFKSWSEFMSRRLAVLVLCAVSRRCRGSNDGRADDDDELLPARRWHPLRLYVCQRAAYRRQPPSCTAGSSGLASTGLTSMHMTFTCKEAVPCDLDRMDFYGMGPDGMHYFGGSAETPDGTHYMMSLTSPEWMLKNPVAPGTMMGPGMGYQNAEMWQAGVAGMNTMMGAQSYMSSYQALALETVVTPAGTFPNALHVHEVRGHGYARDVWYAADVGMVRWMDSQEEALLTKVTKAAGAVPRVDVCRGVLPRGTRPLLHHGGPGGNERARHGPLHGLAAHRHGLQRLRPG